MLSQDVKGMKPFDARPAFLLTREGRPLALLLVWGLADRFLLTCHESSVGAARAHLEKHVIADDVTVGEPHGFVTRTFAPFPAEGGGIPPAGRLVELGGVLVARRDVGTRTAFVTFQPAPLRLNRAQYAFLVGLTPDDLRRFDAGFDALRVEEGVPAWGAEIDGRVLPTETGPMDAISTTKGCYPGQEPVVMSLHRGHPPTRLCRLSLEGDAVPARDEPLTVDGRAAGRVTTAVATPAGVRALALVRHASAREGAALRVGAAAATVTRVLV
jgi:folate-binding protein YgfZ